MVLVVENGLNGLDEDSFAWFGCALITLNAGGSR
jgi:hypothetical protein